jgi:hypothetical protein
MGSDIVSIGDGMAWRFSSRVAWQRIAGEVVVVDLVEGRALGLNPTGSLIWPLLETKTSEELVTELVGSLGVDEATARVDLDEFLADLESRALIERTP